MYRVTEGKLTYEVHDLLTGHVGSCIGTVRWGTPDTRGGMAAMARAQKYGEAYVPLMLRKLARARFTHIYFHEDQDGCMPYQIEDFSTKTIVPDAHYNVSCVLAIIQYDMDGKRIGREDRYKISVMLDMALFGIQSWYGISIDYRQPLLAEAIALSLNPEAKVEYAPTFRIGEGDTSLKSITHTGI